MLRNYFIIAIRNFMKDKLHASINIFGLAIAIATCITGYFNYQFSQSFDGFHENGDHIYEICSTRINKETTESWCPVPYPMLSKLKDDIPGIIAAIPFDIDYGTMKYDEKVFHEKFVFTGKDFFNTFSFPVLRGDKNALAKHDQIIISEKMALKYFGDIDPIGKQILISLSDGQQHSFIVGGIAENFPLNTTMPCDILVPIHRIKDMADQNINDWKTQVDAVFIQISRDVAPNQVEQELQNYILETNNPNPDWQIENYYLESLMRVTHHNRELLGYPFMTSQHPAAIITPSIIALLILLLACFNYVNISIASSAKRLKEIGIRKVIGAVKYQLIGQFLGENLIICLIALLLGMALGDIFVNAYARLWAEFDFNFNYLESSNIFIFLILLLIGIAIMAGSYPALYLSSFKPVAIFQEKQKLAKTNPIIKILVTFQFVISMINIITGYIFIQNSEFIRNSDIGIKHKNIINVPVQNEQQYNLFKNAIIQDPNIIQTAGTQHTFLNDRDKVEARSGNISIKAAFYQIGENYLQMTGIKILYGRLLNPRQQEDIDHSIIVNETFIKQMGLDMKENQYIALRNAEQEKEYHIVGIVKDFYHDGICDNIEPVILKPALRENYRCLSVEYHPQSIKIISHLLTTIWIQLFPHLPYQGYFYEDTLAYNLQVTDSIKKVFIYISFIASLLLAMGLFALISMNIARRTKEIAVRKILGASIFHIGHLVIKDLIFLLVFAGATALVSGYFIIRLLIGSLYENYVPFSFTPYLFAIIMVLIIAVISLVVQAGKIIYNNPVISLRYE